MKIKIWKVRDECWKIAVPRANGFEVSVARTWELARAQARWLMQHLRSA
jgi:hypothetical protein